MGDDHYRKSKDQVYKDNRRGSYDDDDHRDHSRYQIPKTTAVERILTPGTATNNVIKTVATGIIAGSTIILMGIYGFLGDDFAGASFLPIATAVSSAMATACIWIFGRPKAEAQRNAEITALNRQVNSLNKTIDTMQGHFDSIDKRLTNAEYIEDFEERLARKELGKKISSTLPTSEPSKETEEEKGSSPPPLFSE